MRQKVDEKEVQKRMWILLIMQILEINKYDIDCYKYYLLVAQEPVWGEQIVNPNSIRLAQPGLLQELPLKMAMFKSIY